MFVCPHCQFENPTHNRFCQKCGNALRGLRAIITPIDCAIEETRSPVKVTAGTPPQPPATASNEITQVAQLLTDGQYLQGEPRYQLRELTDAQKPLPDRELVLSVLDCEPAADSPLVQFLDDVPHDMEEADLDEMIPATAFPYWKLQEQFFPMVPELQATWQTARYTVTVIEDRSAWQTLTDSVNSGAVESLELVHWFYEMLTLWNALATFHTEASLLDNDNLRVDDDQVVCVQRLIFNADDCPHPLKDLGQFWQQWLTQVVGHELPALHQLVADIVAETMTDAATVTSRLADIADRLQEEAASAALVDPEAPMIEPPPEEPASSLLTTATIAPASETTAASETAMSLVVDDLLLAAEMAECDETDGIEPASIDDSSIHDLPTMALPMKLYRLDEVGRTHVGRQRSHNEDSFFAETQLQRTDSPAGVSLQARGLYILCDGMGGHSGGEVASHLAVTTLRDYFAQHWGDDLPDKSVIKAGILAANQVIFEQNEAEERAGNARMGTTLVMVLIADKQAIVAHVGDSRLYCLTRQDFSQATVDHEVGQREINRGVEPAIAYARPDAYQLTQALGPRSNEEVAPSINSFVLHQDTLLVLCSDGLSDNDLLDTHVESHLQPLMRSRADLEEGVADLIDLANEHNGHDNITAIIVRAKLRPNLEVIKDTSNAQPDQAQPDQLSLS